MYILHLLQQTPIEDNSFASWTLTTKTAWTLKCFCCGITRSDANKCSPIIIWSTHLLLLYWLHEYQWIKNLFCYSIKRNLWCAVSIFTMYYSMNLKKNHTVLWGDYILLFSGWDHKNQGLLSQIIILEYLTQSLILLSKLYVL